MYSPSHIAEDLNIDIEVSAVNASSVTVSSSFTSYFDISEPNDGEKVRRHTDGHRCNGDILLAFFSPFNSSFRPDTLDSLCLHGPLSIHQIIGISEGDRDAERERREREREREKTNRKSQ
jgi:hypothetical protein